MIHLFNPSTEMALASGALRYTPPKAVASLERRNALFPRHYALPGDAILVREDDFPAEVLPEGIRIVHPHDLAFCGENFMPWGWNPALREDMLHCGYPEERMPSHDELASWRNLAHRRTAAALCRHGGLTHCALEFADVAQACAKIEEWGAGVVKMPWSSSGRGVTAVYGSPAQGVAMRIKQCVARQGSVMLEPLHTKSADFATEWESDGREIRFLGFSTFMTDAAGRYVGNMVAPQDAIVRKIGAPSVMDLPAVLKPLLEKVLVHDTTYPYRGLLGVDSLVTADGKVVECLEINLRRTMGHVALDIFRSTGKESVLKIS